MRWTPAAVLLLLAACAMPSGPRAEVGVYVRPADADLVMQIESAEGTIQGSLLGIANSCLGASVPWTLKIGPSFDELAIIMTSEEVADPRSAEIWIDIQPGGALRVGQGRPDWAPIPGAICERTGSGPRPP